LNGREPGKAPNADKTIYTLDNVDIHADYSIDKDSCLSAGLHFKNQDEYKKAKDQIESTCPEQEGLENTYYQISKNKRLIFFILNNKEMIILAVERNFLLKK
jgi:hypothetical protein